jgi:hypothetical protein
VILSIGERGAIGLSTGEHFVPSRKASGFCVIPVVVARIGIVVQTRHDLAFLRQPGELIQIVSLMCQFHRVAVQVREILRDHLALEVVPGTVPMRSRAFTAGWPGRACVLKYACQVRFPAPTAAASVWQCASAPANPPRLPPSPIGSLVTKKFIIGEGFTPRGYSPGLWT